MNTLAILSRNITHLYELKENYHKNFITMTISEQAKYLYNDPGHLAHCKITISPEIEVNCSSISKLSLSIDIGYFCYTINSKKKFDQGKKSDRKSVV